MPANVTRLASRIAFGAAIATITASAAYAQANSPEASTVDFASRFTGLQGGAVTPGFSFSTDPFGAGIVVGYNFKPWTGNITFGPFASFDRLNQTAIDDNFARGQLVGISPHWTTLGARAGVAATPSVTLYGFAGASWLNQELNLNLGTAASRNTTTPGVTLGVGAEFRPLALQQFGPVSLFARYQHTWLDTPNFSTPTSQAFNSSFKREEDTFKLGLDIFWSAATPPALARPTK